VVDSLRDRSTQVLLEQRHVVAVVDRSRLEREFLTEQVEQVGERVDRGGDEVALDSRDRSLGRTGPVCELLLRQTVPAAGLAQEFSSSHEGRISDLMYATAPPAAAVAASTQRGSRKTLRPTRRTPGRLAQRPPGHRHVALWGRVVECARGWRGSRAYPRMIYVPATRAPYWLKAERVEEVALGLTDYHVPVELLDEDASGPEELVAALGVAAH
jgi:hypothetical protein